MLKPLAFSSLLGGLITLIGTPPNIIISDFCKHNLGSPYHFFDFTPVGLTVSVIGLAFIYLFGWRIIPVSGEQSDDGKKNVESF
jgi:di/tricarboxylate transporter